MKPGRNTKLAVVAVVAGALAVGGVAIAGSSSSSNKDLAQLATALRAKDTFTDAVATELGTSSAKLREAIAGAAADRIDAAEHDGSLTGADANTIRTALVADPQLALRVAQGADVSKKLGITEAKLDEAWGKVLKAQALTRIDQAVKDGWITTKVADQLRARINSATFPGYGFGGGRGFGGHGFGGDHGFGGRGFDGDGDGGLGGGSGLHGPGSGTGLGAPPAGTSSGGGTSLNPTSPNPTVPNPTVPNPTLPNPTSLNPASVPA